MLIPVGYAQANFLLSGNGLPFGAECTLGLRWVSTDPASVLAPGIFAAWVDNIQPNLSSACFIDGVHIKRGPNSTGPIYDYAGTSTSGGQSSAQAAPNLAILVQKTTALGGRKHRGRMYIPGVAETQVLTDGDLASDLMTVLPAALDGFRDDLIALDLEPTLLHGDNTAPDEILDFVVQSKAATQRRRMRR